MNWAVEEMSTINLGDNRLNERAKKILFSLGQDISSSIPESNEDWHSTKATYRFFSNKKVTAGNLLSPHIKESLVRIKQEKRILLVQDTTELNYSSQPVRKSDVKPGYQKNDRIYYLHPLLALTENRLCLGVVDNYCWTRSSLNRDSQTKTQYHSEIAHKPIEEKESFRWLLGYRKGCEIAQTCPDTQCIVIGDRESDIYDIFHESEHNTTGKNASLDRLNQLS